MKGSRWRGPGFPRSRSWYGQSAQRCSLPCLSAVSRSHPWRRRPPRRTVRGRTSGHEGAPAARHERPLPVVLYSPGAGDPRTWETTVVQDLASRGYLVVTIDHTYDSSEVEFPGGRVVDSLWEQWFQEAQQNNDFPALAKKGFGVRIAATRFVLDQP